MTLEDVLADVADLGATGLEILGEGNIPNYPEPPSAWIDAWHGLLEKYGLAATNFGSWVDTTRWPDRDLTVEEGAEQLQLDLRLAHRLGFTSVRPKFGVTTWELDPHPIWEGVVERSLDLAAELDVVIIPEIHAPTPIKHPVTQGYIDFIEKTGTEHFKLLIDTGIFQTAPVLENAEGLGTDDEDEIPPPLRALAVPMADLAEVLPHTHFIQAKFFEIDDDLNDLHVPWADIVATLQENGWTGWLSSEYEGRREPYRGSDQVRRQHALLRSLVDRSA
jgi:sugar phosphate isomerase/epimerase